MLLREFWNYDDHGDFKDSPRYSPEEDKHSTINRFQTRKTRLTFRQISKMRKMDDVRRLERVKDLKNIRKQFSQIPDEPGVL